MLPNGLDARSVEENLPGKLPHWAHGDEKKASPAATVRRRSAGANKLWCFHERWQRHLACNIRGPFPRGPDDIFKQDLVRMVGCLHMRRAASGKDACFVEERRVLDLQRYKQEVAKQGYRAFAANV